MSLGAKKKLFKQNTTYSIKPKQNIYCEYCGILKGGPCASS